MGLRIPRLGTILGFVICLSGGSVAATDPKVADAIEKRDRTALQALLKQHTDVNIPQADGATALHWAAHWNDVDVVNLLIQAGANVNAPNAYGVTPLSLACAEGSTAVAERLLDVGANPNTTLPSGETPVMAAARAGDARVVRALLAHGAQIGVAEHVRGQTPLMWAASESHPDVTRILLEGGADVRARSKGGFTALLFAARSGDVESARPLIERGASVNESDAESNSPLLMAVASAQEAVALLLLDKGADPNLANSFGYVPLQAVVWKPSAKEGLVRPNGSTDLVKALLAHGANPNARIAKDPPALAGSYRFETGLVGATPYWLAARSANPNVMRALAAGGADVRATSKDGTSPLMIAAGLGQPQGTGSVPPTELIEAVKAALELGADLDATNQAGQTAIHGAAAVGFDDIIRFLADHGANVNVKDRRGQTPLGAAQRRGTGAASTIALLRKLGGVAGDSDK